MGNVFFPISQKSIIHDCHGVTYYCCINELKTKHPTRQIQLEVMQLQPDEYREWGNPQRAVKDYSGVFERNLAPQTLDFGLGVSTSVRE